MDKSVITPPFTEEQIEEINRIITDRIVMFYEHAVKCGGMSHMTPEPIYGELKPKPDLKVVT